MITEDYVSLKTARLLKEKGFDVNCITKYRPDDSIGYWSVEGLNAPTLQMAMKWLREIHNIAICICAYYSTNPYELNYRNNKPYWKIGIMNHISSRYYDSFNNYEEACEAAIQYCLENLI